MLQIPRILLVQHPWVQEQPFNSSAPGSEQVLGTKASPETFQQTFLHGPAAGEHRDLGDTAGWGRDSTQGGNRAWVMKCLVKNYKRVATFSLYQALP